VCSDFNQGQTKQKKNVNAQQVTSARVHAIQYTIFNFFFAGEFFFLLTLYKLSRSKKKKEFFLSQIGGSRSIKKKKEL
jgi:hypothetical protein